MFALLVMHRMADTLNQSVSVTDCPGTHTMSDIE